MTTPTIKNLQGKTVLVCSATDSHNPPTAQRGTIRILDTDGRGEETRVEVVLSYPDMFNRPAHDRIIVLDREQLAALLSTDDRGTFRLMVDSLLE